MPANQIPRRKAHRPQRQPMELLSLVARDMNVSDERILNTADRMPGPVEARVVLAGLLYECAGMSTGRIAAMVGTSRSVVSKWLHRWRGMSPSAHRRWYVKVEAIASRNEVAA